VYAARYVSGLVISPNLRTGKQWPERVYREARKLDHADADAVFISCTNYRTFEIIERLERDLDLPVVTSNQATLWNTLRRLSVEPPERAPGRLFDR
jgi:maleate isomerase